jgi:hypothetical protein
MRKVALILVCACMFVACDKRYEDGPCLSFVKAENRLCGLWYIENMWVNDIEPSAVQMDTLNQFRIAFFMNSSKALFMSVSDTGEIFIPKPLWAMKRKWPRFIGYFRHSVLSNVGSLPA